MLDDYTPREDVGGGGIDTPDGFEWRRQPDGTWALVPLEPAVDPSLEDAVTPGSVEAGLLPAETPLPPTGNTPSINTPSPYYDPMPTPGYQAAPGNDLPMMGGPPLLPTPEGAGGPGMTDTAGADNMFGTFTPPGYTAPNPFGAPAPFSYEAFRYDPFRAPTLQEAQAEPGYEFATREGLRAIQNSKAAQGSLRTGGTLKNLLRWGQSNAEQNYQNVYNRSADTYDRNRAGAFGAWSANRGNAADAYATNYGIGRDVWDRNAALTDTAFDRNYKSAWDVFSSGREGQQLTLDEEYRRWKAMLEANTQIALAPIPGV